MNYENEYTTMVSYSQFTVFDHNLTRPFNEWTDKHVMQGFSWRPGSASFRTIDESGQHIVIIRLNPPESDLAPDAIRVIDVPFEVSSKGEVEIGSISETVVINLPPGTYQLRFECSPSAADFNPKIRLSFINTYQPHFLVVRADPDIKTDQYLLRTASPA